VVDSVSAEALQQVVMQAQALAPVEVAQVQVVVPQQAGQPPVEEEATETMFSNSCPS
jgi:metal-dependent HD superfamily phosphatase/phosphodiesterase